MLPSNVTVMPSASKRAQANSHNLTLSNRELEVLKLICDGLKSKEVGENLRISHKTVQFHRAKIVTKLGANSTAMLVRYAIRHRLIEP